MSAKELEKVHSTSSVRIHHWQHYYPTEQKLLEAVLGEAAADSICQKIIARFREQFDHDLLAGDSTTRGLWLDVVKEWGSSMTGNLERSPSLRYMLPSEQAAMWRQNAKIQESNAEWLDGMAEEDQPTRAFRDQVRVFQNITVAARAIAGEVACAVTKRLEKLFALRLCRSRELLDRQAALIELGARAQQNELGQAIEEDEVFAKSAQYCSYYLPPMARIRSSRGYKSLFFRLTNMAIGKRVLVTDEPVDKEEQRAIEECIAIFRLLPPVIRCAIIINDTKRVNNQVDHVSPKTFSRVIEKEGGGFSVLHEGRPSKYVPQIHAMINKWNQDEYSDAVITYRTQLCPLWGGTSGHMHGLMHYWHTACSAPQGTPQVIACSMFALWRLYYDKRITPVHTITETFEATFNQDGVVWPNWSGFVWQPSREESAWSVVSRCEINGGHNAVDPIKLMNSLILWAWPAQRFTFGYSLLKQLIDSERKALLDQHYVVPQWSHDTSTNSGTNVKQFVPKGHEWRQPSSTGNVVPPFPLVGERRGISPWGRNDH
ncbi:hypothetical protein [Cystobacter ferrugineus]|uniref:Uncharacterized protein n=1 Tax=Cystobacter ferrugineus TaxID=83449 RepID=A0A1L9AXY6_9BACT|nr:hypothetical protein [Cystobacter ferrugineus]OJH34860.1 hypothetical protein BON30_40410 [Cystobacter ferrugineus]